MGIEIKGVNSLCDKLENLNNNIDRNVRSKVEMLAQEISDEAKDLAPVDTGFLRENIYWSVEDKENRVEAEIVSNADYGGYVEFGTGKVGESAGLVREGINLTYRQTPWRYKDEEGKWHYTEGMKPQPYLYPAMKQNEDRVKEELKSAITMELK